MTRSRPLVCGCSPIDSSTRSSPSMPSACRMLARVLLLRSSGRQRERSHKRVNDFHALYFGSPFPPIVFGLIGIEKDKARVAALSKASRLEDGCRSGNEV